MTTAFAQILQPDSGPVRARHYLPATTGTVLWGRLPCELDRRCVRAAVSLLQARFGMDPEHALAYLSAATDFHISQVVDVVSGVHARIRVADFQTGGSTHGHREEALA